VLSYRCAEKGSHGLATAATIAAIAMLGGCGTIHWTAAQALAPDETAVEIARGHPVAPAAAQILASAPAGARLDYPFNGRTVSFVLGGTYRSGAQLPCRTGRMDNLGAGPVSTPTVYAFCNSNGEWYEMNPVVVSGY